MMPLGRQWLVAFGFWLIVLERAPDQLSFGVL